MAINQGNEHTDVIEDMLLDLEIRLGELEALKQFFRNDINSLRLMSSIGDLPSLLDILDSRDLLSERNRLRTYQSINEILKNPEIEIALFRGNTGNTSYILINEFRAKWSENMAEQKVTIPHQLQEPRKLCTHRDHKTNLIYKIIAEEIGQKWKEFGHGINMRQCEIDKLEMCLPNQHIERVYRMLEKFEEEERIDPRRRIDCICEALEDECNLKQLSRKVREIMSR